MGKFGNRHIERPPSEDEDGAQGDASTSHGTSKIASKPLEGKQEVQILRALRKKQLCQRLDLRLVAFRIWRP